MTSYRLAAAAAAVIALLVPGGNSSPFTLSDERVRGLDVTPVLGRGYSLMTDTFLATCLNITQNTEPSYNYDQEFFDFTQYSDYDAVLTGPISNIYAYNYIKEQVQKVDSTTQTVSGDSTTPRTFFFVTTMRVERFYSSIEEENSPLTTASVQVLRTQDYAGFFQACGPNYVRSIRRAQEVTAFFKFDSFRVRLAQEFALLLRGSATGKNVKSVAGLQKSKFSTLLDSMEIKIMAFGMSLNQAGSGSLVPDSIESYNEVMKFAYQAMTQSDSKTSSGNAGMVYGIEFVPWVDNVAFQMAAGIQSENVEVLVPRELIERAYITNTTELGPWTNNSTSLAERNKYKCTTEGVVRDKYGYCCEMTSMFDIVTRKYGGISNNDDGDAYDHSIRICKPTRSLEKSFVKSNMSANAEFVGRLDQNLRVKLNQLSTLEQCVSSVKAIDPFFDYHILKPNKFSTFDPEFNYNFTVMHLKLALDPLNDFGLVAHIGKEIDEYTEMYYRRCLSALNGGLDIDQDPRLFMSRPWQTHESCLKLKCLGPNKRWDRSDGGNCADSLITGRNAAYYTDDNDGSCILDGNASEETEVCKYPAADLATFQASCSTCWNAVLPPETLDYLMELFCLPTITGVIIPQEDIDALQDAATGTCGYTFPEAAEA